MPDEDLRLINAWSRFQIARGEVMGKVEGRAKAIIDVLEARGLQVPEEVRERVSSCTDLEQLDVWVRAAATVESARDLLR